MTTEVTNRRIELTANGLSQTWDEVTVRPGNAWVKVEAVGAWIQIEDSAGARFMFEAEYAEHIAKVIMEVAAQAKQEAA